MPLLDTLVATGHPDDDPVAKTLGRERLRAILDGTRALTELERGALALSANDCKHRDSARVLGVGERAVNNALPGSCLSSLASVLCLGALMPASQAKRTPA